MVSFTLDVIDTPTRPSLRLPSITPNLFSGSLMEVLNLEKNYLFYVGFIKFMSLLSTLGDLRESIEQVQSGNSVVIEGDESVV